MRTIRGQRRLAARVRTPQKEHTLSKQYGFLINTAVCTGCGTCQAACIAKNNLTDGRSFRRVKVYEIGSWRQDRMTGDWVTDITAYGVSMSCNHCDEPSCADACPTGAQDKRFEDGLVLIDESKCIGCGMCARACPYGALSLNETTRKMTKCNACEDRLREGLNPDCVDACPYGALAFGEISKLREQYGSGSQPAFLPDPEMTEANLIVLMPEDSRPGKPRG